jgi:outer membrane cobalamin receptor
VSKRAEPLSDAAASVFVITADDIRRAGATTLPEALRLAPGLQVSRDSATGYVISARGFNATNSNKLLVLIDGRSVYTPLFSGVFWDVQDLVLEDVERIEVISGPGGTLWGVNAVNGIINVITQRRRRRARWWPSARASASPSRPRATAAPWASKGTPPRRPPPRPPPHAHARRERARRRGPPDAGALSR